MKAKQYLEQLKKIDALIENKLEEKKQWFSIATGTAISMSERVQSSGSQQKMADAVCRYVDIEPEIDKAIDKYVDKKREVISTIEELRTVEYNILHKMYVGIIENGRRKYLDLYEIADYYEKSYSWATTQYGNALNNIQKILDSRKDLIQDEP